MHESIYNWCARHVPDGPVSVLDVGGRDVNGTTRGLFAEGSEITSVDLREGPCVDVVADVCDVDLGEFDVVICTSVFEHAENWREMIAAAFRHLKSGGRFISTCAGPGWPEHSAEDGRELRDGEYYANVSGDELAEAMRDAGFVDVFASSEDTTDERDTVGVGWKP